jgi:ribosomal protein S18 acetylase RimI-like enzyme
MSPGAPAVGAGSHAAGAAGGVRRGQSADAPAVARMWRALVAAHAAIDPAFRPGADAGPALGVAAAHLLDDPEAAVWVWEEQGRALGFCAARVEHAPPSALDEAARAEITELWVEPEARRRGAGRALAETALAWTRSRGTRRLEVRVAARNAAGQAFWRALGFAPFVDVLDRRL